MTTSQVHAIIADEMQRWGERSMRAEFAPPSLRSGRPISLLMLRSSGQPTPAIGLPFEDFGYGVNEPGAWLRLYATVPGYCREFGWRACFFGGSCE